MSSAPDAPRNRHDEQWGGPNPSTCDDLVWWDATEGLCGGCGAECHTGPCTEVHGIDPWYGYARLICDRCPDRRAQGWFE